MTLLLLWSAPAMAGDLSTATGDSSLVLTSEIISQDGSSPILMCCDKWNGHAKEETAGNFVAYIQKGLQKKTRKRVGDSDGYSTKEAAQKAADAAADEENAG